VHQFELGKTAVEFMQTVILYLYHCKTQW